MNARHQLTRHARVIALCAALGLIAATAARAERWIPSSDPDSYRYDGSPAHWTADGRLVDVQIQVDGSAAPLYFRPDTYDRHYFQAFRGRNYSIVVRNTTGRRVGVLIAVDGLNVVSGERSSLSRDESMYVLDPWESAVISGWRTSLREVRRFMFVDEERSYAERTGQANGDMGWLRVLAFREVEREPVWSPLGKVRAPLSDRGAAGAREKSEFESAPSAPAPETAPRAGAVPDQIESAPGDRRAQKSESMYGRDEARDASPGTGWGERRQDPVRRTLFEAARHATDRIALRYEYAAGLRALGIFPQRARLWDRERGQLGFAKPPLR